jgi:phosphoenolpyruvate-protein phosphotransferase
MNKTLRAIAAAPGIAIGQVLWLKNEKLETSPRQSNPDHEMIRLNEACKIVRENINRILASMQNRPEEAAIFNAHLLMLDDPDLIALTQTHLDKSAEYAWNSAIQYYADQMDALQDEYFRARAADIRDVGKQVLQTLLGIRSSDLSSLKVPVILLARDLTPSDTGRMDSTKILGFATQEGSSTSHTAILAKALGLPAVVGAGSTLEEIIDGSSVILNGKSGELIIDPDEATLKKYLDQQNQDLHRRTNSLVNAQQAAVTKDGHRVEVVANIGSLADAEKALANGAEGVGLLRTEFLYMERNTAPDENTQFKIYRSIFDKLETLPVVIRTLDIGGDKYPPYMDLGQETNPFLGWRAIRVCLDRPDFFKTQLRAILRATVGHDIRIMFPMIATLDELRRAKTFLVEAQAESGITYNVQIGIMVEIPSVVQIVDLFAPEVDFFSIGTNDLTQYTFAVDRTNPRVASIANACHPSILRQIQRVIQVAHANGKWVGLCGEIAGDPEAIPILLGLGLDELSMSSGSIPAAKEIIRQWSMSSAEKLIPTALNLDSAAEVRKLVTNFENIS